MFLPKLPGIDISPGMLVCILIESDDIPNIAVFNTLDVIGD